MSSNLTPSASFVVFQIVRPLLPNMKSPFGDCSRPRHTRNYQRAHTVFARVPQSHRDAINPACTLSIDSPEPIYGLAVIGISSKANIAATAMR